MEITLKHLRRNYGSLHAVDDVSLNIPSNTVFGIIGRSGAGKSTLVRLISMLERPDEGEVYYDDKRVDNLEKNLEITSLIKDEARKCHEAAHNASLDDGTVEAIHKLLEVSKKMRIAMRTMVKNVGDEFCPEPYIPEHSPID